MAKDPILEIANLRAIQASRELEVEISRKHSFLLPILADFRLKAAESLVALALVDPHDSKTIMKLQNEVKKYDELFDSLRATIAAGAQLEKQLSDEQREQFIDMMVESGEGQELIDAGLLDDGGAFDS